MPEHTKPEPKFRDMSRFVLGICGFKNFSKFADYAGVSVPVVGALLYDYKYPYSKAQATSFLKALEALQSLYALRRNSIPDEQRIAIDAWMKRWVEYCIKHRVVREKNRGGTSNVRWLIQKQRRRQKREKIMRAAAREFVEPDKKTKKKKAV